MTAFLSVKRSFDPLTKSWGFSVTHESGDRDGAWGFSRFDAIDRLWPRLAAKGYTIYFITGEQA